ncbi:MAG: VWA domain-containing protein [Acidobacteriota bacterium]|nr:VWA domain-containing protein [Acidobacteriota bacterium]
MGKIRPIVWFLVAALTLPAAPGVADDEEQEGLRRIGGLTFVDEVALTIANLVVYVTDKKGRAVTTLTKDDFEISQDGDPKQISNFKLYTSEVVRSELSVTTGLDIPEATPIPDATSAAGPQPVYLVLYVDNQNLDPLDRNRVLSQTRDFLRISLHPPAQMMVVAYQRSFEVLQEFTSDPSEVLKALRLVRTYTGGRTEQDSSRQDIVDRIQRLQSEQRAGSGSGRGGSSSSEWNEIYNLIDNYAKESVNELQFTLDSLRQIISSLTGLPGKKGVIYVSNGLPMIPGMELFYEASKSMNDSTILSRTFEYDRTRIYRQLAATANAQDVTLYTIDASGLSLHGMGSAEYTTASDPMMSSIGRNNYTDSLRFLSDETGGIAIFNTNDIGPRLELVAQDMFTYYSIGYPLQASGQDKVHRVKVKLRDDPAFSEYELRYRPLFVEKSLETRVQDRVVSSLVFEIDENPIGLKVEAGTPAAATEDRWLLPTHLSFPITSVALLPEGDDFVARIVLFIAARDTDGKRSDLVRQMHEIRVPAAGYEAAQSKDFGIDTQLLMESGRYKISIALLDPLTRQVSYRTISTAVHPGR